ncbi:MAG: hypothetical protein OXR72_04555 [Gemmatimonadota bacterium]|nr:hypothetical protein [Gemmatimonadota bacterium]
MRQLIIVLGTVMLLSPADAASRPVTSPDFDGDGTVGFGDLVLFAGAFGSSAKEFDLDGDGVVGFSDFVIFASRFGRAVPLTVDRLNFPLRALHAAGNWGTNDAVVNDWETAGRTGPVVPPDYIDWLKSLHVNWVGLMISVHYDDSMDGTVERVYSSVPDHRTFPDDALRQMIRDFRDQGIEVYLTLFLNDIEAGTADRPAHRWQLGDPRPPKDVLPVNWPWRPAHPDHQRFVAEFWESYTQQAVHFAKIAEAEGARMFSLGTETDALFRTRPGDPEDPVWTNDFSQQLRAMVARVRAVYSGLLTYDMHYGVLMDPVFWEPGSGHLWDDLQLDVVGLSAWFPLLDTMPVGPISIRAAQDKYQEIFETILIPLAERNPGRPIMFLEYGAADFVTAPLAPDRLAPDGSGYAPFIFADANDNGVDDGHETQSNIYQALLNAMFDSPGVLDGVFFHDNWIAGDELWAEWWAGQRSYSIRGKPAENVVRKAYAAYKENKDGD